MLEKVTRAGNFLVKLIVILFITIFLIYGSMALLDMLKTDIQAYPTSDLLQCKPTVNKNGKISFKKALELNPDVCGWITIEGTNIDYPVLKGKNDAEYINKDVYGKNTVTGSIFMSFKNNKDFHDPYTVIYGHHMENGALFGDIDKFKKRNFFKKKRLAYLITKEKIYDLDIFSYFETSAYNEKVYNPEKTDKEKDEFLKWAKNASKHWISKNNINKVLAMSTCKEYTTDKREVLLAKMTVRTKPLPSDKDEFKDYIGHPMAGAYWAVLNLYIMLITIYAAFPVHLIVKRKKEKIIVTNLNKLQQFIYERRKRFNILSAILAVGSVILFVLTEDLNKPIQLIDIWTPIMMLPLIVIWRIRDIQLKNTPGIS